MFKVFTTIKKEFSLLLTDKVGLVLMFVMPIVLVIVLTVVQNSAFQIVNENKLALAVVNRDLGPEGKRFVHVLEKSKLFAIKELDANTLDNLSNALEQHDQQLLIEIPNDFSTCIENNAAKSSNLMMSSLGLGDSTNSENRSKVISKINFYHDPVLEDNYTYSVLNVIQTFIQQLEAEKMMSAIYNQLGYQEIPDAVNVQLKSSSVELNKIVALNSKSKIIPNATQHNVPAWTVFALFFMVVSLGNNMVREKVRGSFVRLKLTPTNFAWVIGSKMLVYFVTAVSIVTVIFGIGRYIFPMLELPMLQIPSNLFTLALVVFSVASCAISYAILIGCWASSTEQSNGFGSVSVVIFAALGGVWVPLFVMPETMQIVAKFSPLYWCLDAFYGVLLKDQNTWHLFGTLTVIWTFAFACLGLGFFKLQTEKLI